MKIRLILSVFACALAACVDSSSPNEDSSMTLLEPQPDTPMAMAGGAKAPSGLGSSSPSSMLIDDDPPAAGQVADPVDPVVNDEPKARVYLNDPVTDDGQTSEVILPKTTNDDGRLTSEWVQVVNCLNEEGGLTANPDLGGFTIQVSLCHEKQVVRPDADGNYLSIVPPQDDTDPNDSFAELMMYYHVNRAHDYFKEAFGFSALDFPLPALVNVQFRTDPVIPFLNPGPDGWIPFANAAFFPKESWQAFAAQFGLPPRDQDSIIFFQGEQDFAYDSRVIYHEYTHAVVGTSRLQAPIVSDEYGLDNSPRSMNEGLADFFAASLADDPVIGKYVGVMGLGLRDLSSFVGALRILMMRSMTMASLSAVRCGRFAMKLALRQPTPLPFAGLNNSVSRQHTIWPRSSF